MPGEQLAPGGGAVAAVEPKLLALRGIGIACAGRLHGLEAAAQVPPLQGEGVVQDPVTQHKQVTLVVDDDEAIRAALRDVLGDAGYAVATAASGRDAIRFLEQHGADAVVLDLMMPGGPDGWAVAAYMSSHAQLAGIPLVVMTANGLATLRAAPIAAAYLTKPVSLDTLLGALRRVLTLRPPPLPLDEHPSQDPARLRAELRAPRAPSVLDAEAPKPRR